jgi:succinate dehydrogenase/fumarate reductase flavoprotein subunit
MSTKKKKGQDTIEMDEALSRRSFLTGAAVMAAGAAATGLAACTQAGADGGSGSTGSNPNIPTTWDDEADLVIIGYGGAGAAAAIAADNAGASVIVLEKDTHAEGGNTGNSSGSIHTTIDVDDVNEHIAKITRGCFGTTSAPVIKAIAEGMTKTRQWMIDQGIELVMTSETRGNAQRPAGRTWQVANAEGKGGEGWVLFKALNDIVVGKGIEVRFETPATKLIQNPDNREILGVKATNGGKDLFFKAKKAVILACGGYENDPEMQGWYNYPGLRLWPWGTPYNTGDGIKMGIEVGASLWHLHGLEWAAVNFLKPTIEAGCAVGTNATTGIVPFSYFFVNKTGGRFMNDAKGMGHDVTHKPVTDFNDSGVEFLNVPFFMIFDQAQFDAGPLYTGTGRSNIINTYAGVENLCDWGSDNNGAVTKGWILKGDTIEELAGKLSAVDPAGDTVKVDAAGLAATLAKFNEYAASGTDPDFERPADRMTPLTGPYYAIELGLTTINTQGGPEHDEFNRTIAVDGTVIPRLYNVGELGSVNGYVYVAGNIAEALTTGRIAADHAVTLDAWE